MRIRAFIAAVLALLAVPSSAQFATTPSGFKFYQSDTPDTRLRKLEILRTAVAAGGGGGGVTSFNTRTGAVSLTSGDVTSALTFTPLAPANNLSDVASASTARTNLGLGYFATGTDAANLTGTVSINRFNSGTGASTTTFLRGDGTWVAPAGSGTTTNSVTWNNGGSGAASGATFNGSAAVTISYNTIGAAPLASPTFTGKVTTAASASGGAGFNLPHGAAPSSPANGDVWTTTSGLFGQINGATKQFATGTGTATGTNTGDQTITLTGDVTGSGTGSFATAIGANRVTRSMLAATSGAALLGATAAGNVADLTGTQATTLLDTFTSSLKGLAPSSGGGTTNFLRADGTWAAPPGGGTVTSVSVVTANGVSGSVATATTTPAITLTLGAITPSSVAATGTVTGSNLWTEKVLTSDFTNSTVTASLITDGTNALSFTPPANSNWEAEAVLLIETATATVGPRVGVSVAAQGTSSYGSCLIETTGATAATFAANFAGWTTASGGTASTIGDWPTVNTPFLVRVTLRGHSGASPALIQLTLASETAATTVTAMKGSLLRTKST